MKMQEMNKAELIEDIIANNGNVTNWGWDAMGVYDTDYASEKYSGSEIYENKHNENFMSDVARDYFEGFDSVEEIVAYCNENGFEISE